MRDETVYTQNDERPRKEGEKLYWYSWYASSIRSIHPTETVRVVYDSRSLSSVRFGWPSPLVHALPYVCG